MARRFGFTKKISLLAALLLVFGSMIAWADRPIILPEELFTAVEVEGGVEITAYKGEGIANLYLPDKLGDSAVVSIGTGAFWGNSDIASVSLPQSVTRIGDNAFTGCTQLTYLSGDIISIGDYAFYGCDELAEIVVSGKLESIGKGCFGKAVPKLSVSDQYSIDSLLSVQQLVASLGGQATLGSVGYVEVTPEMLELNNSLVKLLDETLSTEVDKLWQPDLVTITNPDGSVYTTGFADFYGKLRSTKLYSIIGTLNRAKLEARLDAMIGGLLDDAKRLQ